MQKDCLHALALHFKKSLAIYSKVSGNKTLFDGSMKKCEGRSRFLACVSKSGPFKNKSKQLFSYYDNQ